MFFFIVITLSTIRININKINLLISEEKLNKVLFDFDISVYLYLFNKIKILELKLNKEKLKGINIKERINSKQVQILKKEMTNKKEAKKIIKRLGIDIYSLNLNVKLDTSNVILTSSIVTASSIILSILLGRIIRNNEKVMYEITPIYANKNKLKIDFNCIINVKMVHIISIIFIFIKKRRDDKNERTSNRRAYDYSYE